MRVRCLPCLLLAAAPALAQEPPRVAVLGIAPGEGVSAKQAALVEELLMNALHRTGAFRLLGRGDVASLVGFERQKQMLGCTDTTCMAEAAGALGVPWIASGNLGKLGALTVVSMKVIDVKKARVAARADASTRDEGELPAALERIAQEVAAQCVREGCGVHAGSAPARAAAPPPGPATAPPPAGSAADEYDLKNLWWEEVAPAAQQQGVVTQHAVLYRGRYRQRVGDREFLEILGREDLVRRFDENLSARRAWNWTAAGLAVGGAALALGTVWGKVGCDADGLFCNGLHTGLAAGGLGLLLLAPITLPWIGAWRNPYPIDYPEQRRLSEEYNRELRRSLGLEPRGDEKPPPVTWRWTGTGVAGTF